MHTVNWSFRPCRAPRPEPNGAVWMEHGMQKFSVPGQAVVYPFAATNTAEKACMLLLRHHGSVWSEIDTACFKEGLSGVLKVLTR